MIKPDSESPAASQRPSETSSKVTLWQVLMSVAAAFFGVQSERNRVRDFTQGSAVPFIVVGLIMTGVFIGVLVVIVKLIMLKTTQ